MRRFLDIFAPTSVHTGCGKHCERDVGVSPHPANTMTRRALLFFSSAPRWRNEAAHHRCHFLPALHATNRHQAAIQFH
ncbi:hypothetical protein EV696_102366 [Permianibacter aggregans]|uniref:Uncharacterized protein n=1 Tax=Permianibacter aggregans TaxID=1510150 RepID=A0A4R6UXM9_9GAMM|nr:hypothetical protein EV696_102366 [Permianibacter aggregans]